jgi:TPR repeat protein
LLEGVPAGAPQVQTAPGNGAAELALAENYLNGRPTGVRDSSEAAKWLWKSVGKRNAGASLLLSDLYLRGDGVPQSCDQARLLLYAAARRRARGAAERIRNLQAFGCQ